MTSASSSLPAGNGTSPRISEKTGPEFNDGDDLNSLENSQQHRTASISSQPSPSLSRIQSAMSTASQHYNTVLSHVRSRNPDQMRPFAHPLSHQKTSPDVIVGFDGPDDAYNPINWPFRKKAITTLLYGLTTMGSTWSSAVYSPGIAQVDADFNASEQVGVLGVSFLLFGFGLGPLLWAPLSELYGRKPAVLFPYFIAAIFMFASGSAKDIQTVVISRFFAGFFGSAPITNTGGVLSDLFPPEQRAVAIVGYALAVVGGPSLGPIVGAAIVQSDLRWRWAEYITGIMMIFFLILDVIFIDETYPAALLVKKARRLRYETGNWALHARHEEWDVSFIEMANKYLIVPFQLLCTPICLLIATYASFVYGILYLSLSSFPIAFIEVRGWGYLVGHLPFLGLLAGVILGGGVNIYNQKFYLKKFYANNRRPVPEARLPPMMVGSVFFSAGLFIFGWTSPTHIPWIAQVIGTVSLGFGFFTVFQAALNYLIDTFSTVSASAIGATTFLRSFSAGSFPLFSRIMYGKLGVPWASSLLGFVSLPLILIPYLFYIYGKRIRARGKWSRSSVYPP
ncbi:MFS multidrug transporter [Blastomyces dermatitidis ATCC 18188]|uniref:MFS multidrug transporter n=1 Tax=Ajellomyces dermatitidis (strain ATCC 18188 / CBS 674.68) TaxID=653446 RepID=F2TBV8_AJEDA|nr:MFS multidrug transporter [Blastomyces dermatitidis ATCC 18188]